MPEDPIMIRTLKETDLPACVELYQEAYSEPPYGDGWDDATAERIIREFRRLFPRECFVAERDGEVLGFILCSSLAGLRATVEEFSVRPRHQRQGVGRKLLDFVTVRYQQQGIPFLELIANLNAPAYALYRHEGFVEPENYRLMSKEL